MEEVEDQVVVSVREQGKPWQPKPDYNKWTVQVRSQDPKVHRVASSTKTDNSSSGTTSKISSQNWYMGSNCLFSKDHRREIHEVIKKLRPLELEGRMILLIYGSVSAEERFELPSGKSCCYHSAMGK